MANLKYIEGILPIVQKVDDTQADNIKAAAKLCAEIINGGQMVHLFGSGHSVLPIQDMFPRYGGVVGWHPLMDTHLMWSNVIETGGARELLWIERQKGYIKQFLQSYNLQAGEAMIIYSHGGANAAPIECAIYAKEHGLKVIAVTSVDNYKNGSKPTYEYNGKCVKLADIADIVIDNCSPLEDALVEIPGYPQRVGASSTIGAITVTQSLAAETALELNKLGHKLYTFVSPNVEACPADWNDTVYAEYTRVLHENCGKH